MSLDDDLLDRIGTSTMASAAADSQELPLQLAQLAHRLYLAKQSQAYLESLLASSASSPVRVRNAQVTNAQAYRDGFLHAQLLPLLGDLGPRSLESFLSALDTASHRFLKLGIFENLLVHVNALPPSPYSRNTSTMLVPVFNTIPAKRFNAKTGTNVGNGEGDGYIQFHLRNVFGGAENLVFDATTGTRTPSLYLVNFNLPICNHPDYILENVAHINTRKIDWLGAQVVSKGLTNRIYTQFPRSCLNHELILENSYRVLHNHASKATDVLLQAGPHLRSALTYKVSRDTRDQAHLPSRGHFWRIGVELSRLMIRCQAYPYCKVVADLQFAVSLPRIASQLIFTHKLGLLVSLKPGQLLVVLDRFFLGGPNDVRLFSLNGLGPHSFSSPVGGDAFFAGGVSLISRFPFLSSASGFRLHSFFNFGKLVPVCGTNATPASLLAEFCRQYSSSCGIGLLYDNPMVRAELNFGLPLLVHRGDNVRKGFQFGLGVSFL